MVTEAGPARQDVRIENGRFAAIEATIAPAAGDTVIDAAGNIVLPGAVDSHVHFHMPTPIGFNADDFTSGSACAAVSGVTTVVDFASPIQGQPLSAGFAARMNEAIGNCHVDFALHMEITGDFPMDLSQLPALKEMGARALKIYTTYGSTEFPAQRLPELFQTAAALGLITLVHAEENSIILDTREQFVQAGKTGARYHSQSRPIAAETAAIRRILRIAADAGAPIIIAHISSGEGASLVSEARKSGQEVYGETCPHYLLLTDARYDEQHPQRYIMTPPLRTAQDNQALWKLLAEGMLDTVSTDHCPFTMEEKLSRAGCFEAVPGIGGIEALLPLLFTYGYGAGKLSLERLAHVLSTAAAKLYGLYPRKGAIRVGGDADLVLVDPEAEYTFCAADYPSKAGYSVYEGMRLKGKPILTMLRGNVIARDGKVVGAPGGQFVKA